MIISVIAAIAQDRAIGKDNDLLWQLRDDLKLFKETTLGHPVVMGRKSFESIGRPLPGRRNIVVTRKRDYEIEGAEVYRSIKEVYALFENSDEEIFILGGGEVYRQTLDDAHKLYISNVEAKYPEADTYFPKIKWEEWTEIESESFGKNESNDHAFVFSLYKRNQENK